MFALREPSGVGVISLPVSSSWPSTATNTSIFGKFGHVRTEVLVAPRVRVQSFLVRPALHLFFLHDHNTTTTQPSRQESIPTKSHPLPPDSRPLFLSLPSSPSPSPPSLTCPAPSSRSGCACFSFVAIQKSAIQHSSIVLEPARMTECSFLPQMPGSLPI